jgi:hypothetical protein
MTTLKCPSTCAVCAKKQSKVVSLATFYRHNPVRRASVNSNRRCLCRDCRRVLRGGITLPRRLWEAHRRRELLHNNSLTTLIGNPRGVPPRSVPPPADTHDYEPLPMCTRFDIANRLADLTVFKEEEGKESRPAHHRHLESVLDLGVYACLCIWPQMQTYLQTYIHNNHADNPIFVGSSMKRRDFFIILQVYKLE